MEIIIAEGPKCGGKSTFIENQAVQLNKMGNTYVILKKNLWIPTTDIYRDIINHKLTYEQIEPFFEVVDTNLRSGDLHPDVIFFDRFFLSQLFAETHVSPDQMLTMSKQLYNTSSISEMEVRCLMDRIDKVPDTSINFIGLYTPYEELTDRANKRGRVTDKELKTLQDSILFFKRFHHGSSFSFFKNEQIDWESVSKGDLPVLVLDGTKENLKENFPSDDNVQLVFVMMSKNDWLNSRYSKMSTGNKTVIRIDKEEDVKYYLDDPTFKYNKEFYENCIN